MLIFSCSSIIDFSKCHCQIPLCLTTRDVSDFPYNNENLAKKTPKKGDGQAGGRAINHHGRTIMVGGDQTNREPLFKKRINKIDDYPAGPAVKAQEGIVETPVYVSPYDLIARDEEVTTDLGNI